ncbi:hypothetical protein HYPSUDRAFT_198645 [Hypholoma sublateritium FD-334 SS-4]|uniref:Uncharacterized protein n=1 Tax=Hypholoma sublateritium (strain FD-334 SS-4) TaxID=945553 RepID=A0A0D2MS79_HYPSF|nr:hypothetical protein HYPSUDRAFT_198645 [Hypholoma sublateritium FD-334 SS-4]
MSPDAGDSSDVRQPPHDARRALCHAPIPDCMGLRTRGACASTCTPPVHRESRSGGYIGRGAAGAAAASSTDIARQARASVIIGCARVQIARFGCGVDVRGAQARGPRAGWLACLFSARTDRYMVYTYGRTRYGGAGAGPVSVEGGDGGEEGAAIASPVRVVETGALRRAPPRRSIGPTSCLRRGTVPRAGQAVGREAGKLQKQAGGRQAGRHPPGGVANRASAVCAAARIAGVPPSRRPAGASTRAGAAVSCGPLCAVCDVASRRCRHDIFCHRERHRRRPAVRRGVGVLCRRGAGAELGRTLLPGLATRQHARLHDDGIHAHTPPSGAHSYVHRSIGAQVPQSAEAMQHVNALQHAAGVAAGQGAAGGESDILTLRFGAGRVGTLPPESLTRTEPETDNATTRRAHTRSLSNAGWATGMKTAETSAHDLRAQLNMNIIRAPVHINPHDSGLSMQLVASRTLEAHTRTRLSRAHAYRWLRCGEIYPKVIVYVQQGYLIQ